MSNSEAEAQDNNDKKDSKPSIGVFGAEGDEIVLQSKSDPMTGHYTETAIREKTERDSTHIFNSKIPRPTSEKEQDQKNVRFEYLTNEMAKRIRADKYRGNSLTYQLTTNDESDILTGLDASEERAIVSAARQKIELEQKELEKDREQKEIDRHRKYAKPSFCEWCHERVGWAPDSMSRHLKGCTFYMRHILETEENRKIHDNYLQKFEYLFERVGSLTSEMSEIKRFMNALRFTETSAALDKNVPILSAAQEIKTRIMSEKEKRFGVIKEVKAFIEAYQSFLDKCLSDDNKSNGST